MADDLKLAVVIEALLNAKGFEDAKAALRNVADQAAAAAPKTRMAGDAVRGLGEKIGGARGPAADLTRVLLLQVGAMKGIGEASKFAGVAVNALEGAAFGLSATMVGVTAGLAIFLPKLIEWFTKTEDVKEENYALRDSLVDTGDMLAQLIKDVPELNAKYAEMVKTLHGAAMDKQSDRLRELLNRQGELQKKIGEASDEWHKANYQREIDQLQVEVRLLMDAQEKGVTVTEIATAGREKHTIATKEAEEAARRLKTEQEALNAAIQEGIEGQSDSRLRGIQDLLKKDSDRLAEREKNKGQGQLSPELMQRLTEIDVEKQAEKDLADYEAETERQKREARQETAIATVGYIGQTLSALSDAFGGNKALAIAGAIIDTYAGAAAALGPKGPPWPANLAAAASIIATGLAHVQQIRKAHPEGIGFDDPFADLTARQLGRRSAQDFARHFGREFVGMLPGEMERQTVNHYSTRIDRSTTYNLGGINGLMANSPTAFARGLDRALNKADRFRSRTTLGR